MTYIKKSVWYEPILLETLGAHDVWDFLPASPGVYIIMRGPPIPRIGGTDNKGIIYIGKSKILLDRLWSFWRVRNHIASDFLCAHPTIAQTILNNKQIKKEADVEKSLGNLRVRYCAPIEDSFLEEAEGTLFFAYIGHFGEAPPLNLNLPGRWNKLPTKQALQWAREGLYI